MDIDLEHKIDGNSLLKWQTEAESMDPLSSKRSRKICGKWEVERKSWNELKGAQKAFYKAGQRWPDQTPPKKGGGPFPPPLLELRDASGKMFQ